MFHTPRRLQVPGAGSDFAYEHPSAAAFWATTGVICVTPFLQWLSNPVAENTSEVSTSFIQTPKKSPLNPVKIKPSQSTPLNPSYWLFNPSSFPNMVKSTTKIQPSKSRKKTLELPNLQIPLYHWLIYC